ncbi:hypothetical protein [Phormidium nigroviride]
MQHLNYWDFKGFENVYLEDSYVLGIHRSTSELCIHIEAVLTENHSLYTQPLPGEQYCYRRMTIKFLHPHTYNLVLQNINPIPDLDGSVDYGNIDDFFSADGKYYLRGEWGELTIVSDPPLLSEYLYVKSGENTIEIDPDRLISFGWKEGEGMINLIYRENSNKILSIQIDEGKDPEGFAAFLAYMNKLEGDYVTQYTGGEELSFDSIKELYFPDNKDENVQAVSLNSSVDVISKNKISQASEVELVLANS